LAKCAPRRQPPPLDDQDARLGSGERLGQSAVLEQRLDLGVRAAGRQRASDRAAQRDKRVYFQALAGSCFFFALVRCGGFFFLMLLRRGGFFFLALLCRDFLFFLMLLRRGFFFVLLGFDFCAGDGPYVNRHARVDGECGFHTCCDQFSAAVLAHGNRRELFAAGAFVFVGRLQASQLFELNREDARFFVDRTAGSQERAESLGGFAAALEGDVGAPARIEEHGDFVFGLFGVHEIRFYATGRDFSFSRTFRLAFGM
jgi:hypothetical protein